MEAEAKDGLGNLPWSYRHEYRSCKVKWTQKEPLLRKALLQLLAGSSPDGTDRLLILYEMSLMATEVPFLMSSLWLHNLSVLRGVSCKAFSRETLSPGS